MGLKQRSQCAKVLKNYSHKGRSRPSRASTALVHPCTSHEGTKISGKVNILAQANIKSTYSIFYSLNEKFLILGALGRFFAPAKSAFPRSLAVMPW
jgi:hypothetical protein